jgi:cell division protein FtsB
MALLEEIRRRRRQFLLPTVLAVVFAYFAFHIVQGERGILASLHLREEIHKAETTLAGTHAVRSTLEHRVALLSSRSLDPDMLDERARAMLHVGRPGDIIVALPKAAAQD